MLRGLRSRLFISYVAVIVAALALITFVLVVFSSLPQIRYSATLNRLTEQARAVAPAVNRLAANRVSLERIQEQLDQFTEDEQVRILLIGTANQSIVYDSDGVWQGQTLLGNARQLVMLGQQNDDWPRLLYRAPDGSGWILTAVPLEGVRGVAIVFAAPEPARLSLFRSAFAVPLLGGGLIALFLSLGLAAGITRSVAQPLLRMAAAADAIARGDYDQTLPLRGPEEVKRVADDFNRMAAQVKATQQAQRDFLANVSHDLKTPITSIQGWSQALLDGTLTEEADVAHAAGVIHTEASRMTRMVRQLLEIARLASGQLTLRQETVDMVALMRQLYENFRPLADSQGIRLALDLPSTASVTGDRDRLLQALGNLVDNALNHTPAGGTIALRLWCAAHDVIVQVEDTGVGIPAADLDRIFERFYQVDRSRARTSGRTGAGLGLSIVHQLITAHGGTIDIESREGEGTVVKVKVKSEK